MTQDQELFVKHMKVKYGEVMPHRSDILSNEGEGFLRKVRVLFRNWSLFAEAYEQYTIPKEVPKAKTKVKAKAEGVDDEAK